MQRRTSFWPRALWAAVTVLLAGCDQEAAILTGPAVEQLWLGPDVVAGTEELTGLSELATDPLLLELPASASAPAAPDIAAALEAFAGGVLVEPGPAFVALDSSLTAIHAAPDVQGPVADPDVEFAEGVIDLYRDYAAITLFAIERDDLGPLVDPNGS